MVFLLGWPHELQQKITQLWYVWSPRTAIPNEWNSDSSDLASSNSSFEEETAITKVLRCGGVKEFVANQMWRLELSKWVENPNYKWINPTYPNYKWWLENPWKTIRCRSVDPSFLDDSPGGVNALTRKGTMVTRTVLSSVEPHTLW